MPQKPTKRSHEWLVAVGAKNTESRIILNVDHIEVVCICGAEGAANVGNLDFRLKRKNRGWRCSACQKKIISEIASQRVGEKNPFFGKKHSEESRKKISEMNKKAQSTIPKQERVEKAKKATEASYKKYGCNVMHVPEIQKKHHEATHSEEFIQKATTAGLERAKDPVFKVNQKKYSKDFWDSEDSAPFRNKLKEFCTKELNVIGGKDYEKRLEAFKSIWCNKEKVDALILKKEESCLKKYGVRNVMQNPEIRRKSLTKKPASAPEKYITELLLMRSIPFEFQYELNGKCWDFGVFDENGKLILIIEIDGEYHHGLLADPFNSCVGGHNDPARSSLIPEGVKYLEIDSGRVKDAVGEIMHAIGIDYVSWISDLFVVCSSIPFPYPSYDEERLKKDWVNLCKTFTDDRFSVSLMPANSVVTQFHKSIYDCRTDGHVSPREAWSDPDLLLACLENRFVYRSVLSTQQIARGFERNRLAPRVTVFQPSLARFLLANYAPEAKTVVDPFSGFSGRMLGAASLGMTYTGYDIRPETIKESNEIIQFLDLKNCKVSVADFDTNVDDNEYDVLLTCSPYGQKEVWFPDQNCGTADHYTTECLKKFKAKVYIFVIDKTTLYKDNIVQYIGRRSHMAEKSKETVLVFRK